MRHIKSNMISNDGGWGDDMLYKEYYPFLFTQTDKNIGVNMAMVSPKERWETTPQYEIELSYEYGSSPSGGSPVSAATSFFLNSNGITGSNTYETDLVKSIYYLRDLSIEIRTYGDNFEDKDVVATQYPGSAGYDCGVVTTIDMSEWEADNPPQILSQSNNPILRGNGWPMYLRITRTFINDISHPESVIQLPIGIHTMKLNLTIPRGDGYFCQNQELIFKFNVTE